MFAGIGGFRSGLSKFGDFFVPVGFCEIDPYARKAYEAIYDTKGELFFEDARKIVPEELPDIDLICGGFPCQSFSIAGKRGGFEDARGTLFFEIARIARVKRPKYLLLENVPGLLSHDGGRTFATILGTLSELGYDVAWQVLNSADFGIPQSRKRVFLAEHDRIRKLMPIECWRLQGFTDEQFLKAQSAGLSDARLYKMAGNAVSVPVITALGAVIKRIHERKATEVENHAEPCNQ